MLRVRSSCCLILRGRDRPQPQQMTDGIAELGAVEGVEMEVAHAARIEAAAHFGSDRRRHQLARGGLIVEPVDQPHPPHRDRAAAPLGHAPRLPPVRQLDRPSPRDRVCHYVSPPPAPGTPTKTPPPPHTHPTTPPT